MGINPVGQKPVDAGQAPPNLDRVFARLKIRYFFKLFPGIASYFSFVSNTGLVALKPGLPEPDQTLVKEFGFFPYPEHILCDQRSAITIPFKALGQLSAFRMQKFDQTILWGRTLLEFMPQSQRRFSIINGEDFIAERQRRLQLEYAAGDLGSLIKPDQRYLAWLTEMVGARGESLTVGCGNGSWETFSAAHFNNRFVGIELSPEQARRAQQAGIEVVLGDANYLSTLIGGRKFNSVVLFESLGYLWLDSFLPQVRAALRNDGELFFTTPLENEQLPGVFYPSYHLMTWPKVKSLLQAAGFEVTATFIKLKREKLKPKLVLCVFDGTTNNARGAAAVFVRAKLKTPLAT